MEVNGLGDQYRLDGASNYAIWQPRISCLLDEHDLKMYVDSVVVVLGDLDPLKMYKVEMEKTKNLILDGVRDHAVCHIAIKGNTKDMWDSLTMLYQGSSKHQKMPLEEKLRSARMKKGECIDLFMSNLQEVREQLATIV